MLKISEKDLREFENNVRFLENLINELYDAPVFKLSRIVREIRGVQENIERQISEMSRIVEMSAAMIKYRFESLVYVYRAKQGLYEKKINEALFKKPGTFALDEVQKKEKHINALGKKTEKQLASVLSKLVDSDDKREKYMNMIKKQVEAAKSKSGKDMKVKVSISKAENGKPKIKIKLVKKN